MGHRLVEWLNIVNQISNIVLQEGRDIFIWALHSHSSFIVNSMYMHLVSNGIRVTQEIWRTELPAKILFLWYLKKVLRSLKIA